MRADFAAAAGHGSHLHPDSSRCMQVLIWLSHRNLEVSRWPAMAMEF